jgi:hypothetical protein
MFSSRIQKKDYKTHYKGMNLEEIKVQLNNQNRIRVEKKCRKIWKNWFNKVITVLLEIKMDPLNKKYMRVLKLFLNNLLLQLLHHKKKLKSKRNLKSYIKRN